MIVFEKKRSKVRELPLVAMIDVVFILIFFFMLTTSFMRVESMEVKLPSAKGGAAAASKTIARIVLYDDGSITYGDRTTDKIGLTETLKATLAANAEQQMIVYVDEGVLLSQLVEVMDLISMLGGKSVYVRPLPKSVTPTVGGAR
jgi:biopolymer transport protein ExbD